MAVRTPIARGDLPDDFTKGAFSGQPDSGITLSRAPTGQGLHAIGLDHGRPQFDLGPLTLQPYR